MSDMLPYLMIVLCCAQFPAGIAVGIVIKSYDVSIQFNKRRAKEKAKNFSQPTSEILFADID
jgi:hypothetical protein